NPNARTGLWVRIPPSAPHPVTSDEERVMSATVADRRASSPITHHAPLRVVLLVNPAAGMRRTSVALVEEQVRARGAIVETALTSRAGEGVVIARQAAVAGADVLLACGGDGTLNEAVNGLAGTHTALAVLPAGTVNVWAREVGIPPDPAKALNLLWDGERRWIDLGRAGQR